MACVPNQPIQDDIISKKVELNRLIWDESHLKTFYFHVEIEKFVEKFKSFKKNIKVDLCMAIFHNYMNISSHFNRMNSHVHSKIILDLYSKPTVQRENRFIFFAYKIGNGKILICKLR